MCVYVFNTDSEKAEPYFAITTNFNETIINILSPMNIWNTKQPYLSIFGVWKIKV